MPNDPGYVYTKLIILIGAVFLVSMVFTACAPIKEFGDGIGRTVDKLVHPNEW